MDDSTFDQLARRFGARASRRAALGILSGAGLAATLTGPRLEGLAKRKKKKRKCKPESAAATCAGRCGSIENNCKQSVTCNPCQECGGTSEPCCPGNACDGGHVCLSGTCEECGSVGAPCCSTGGCVPFIGSGCFSGTCQLCGAAGEQCCPGANCNNVGFFCNGATCQS